MATRRAQITWCAVVLHAAMWLPVTFGAICHAPNVLSHSAFSPKVSGGKEVPPREMGVDGTGHDLVQSWLPSIPMNQVAVFVRKACFFFDETDVGAGASQVTVVPVWYRVPGSGRGWALMERQFTTRNPHDVKMGRANAAAPSSIIVLTAPLLTIRERMLLLHCRALRRRGGNQTTAGNKEFGTEHCTHQWPSSVEIWFQLDRQFVPTCGNGMWKARADVLAPLHRPMTLNLTYCHLPHPSSLEHGPVQENASVVMGSMYIAAPSSGVAFRRNILPNLVYHWLQGITARIIHIEASVLEAWKEGAAPWLKNGRLHLVVHNRNFTTVDSTTGTPTTKGIKWHHSMINAYTLYMAKGVYEWVGFHDWDEYIYALSGKGISHELSVPPEMEFVTEIMTPMVATKRANSTIDIDGGRVGARGLLACHIWWERATYTNVLQFT